MRSAMEDDERRIFPMHTQRKHVKTPCYLLTYQGRTSVRSCVCKQTFGGFVKFTLCVGYTQNAGSILSSIDFSLFCSAVVPRNAVSMYFDRSAYRRLYLCRGVVEINALHHRTRCLHCNLSTVRRNNRMMSSSEGQRAPSPRNYYARDTRTR